MMGMSSSMGTSGSIPAAPASLTPPGAPTMVPQDRTSLGCSQCPRPYVPFRALTLATRSWKPWAQRLGTSSSTISIFRPVYPAFSKRWILWSGLSWGEKGVRGLPVPPQLPETSCLSPGARSPRHSHYSRSGAGGWT